MDGPFDPPTNRSVDFRPPAVFPPVVTKPSTPVTIASTRYSLEYLLLASSQLAIPSQEQNGTPRCRGIGPPIVARRTRCIPVHVSLIR
ncbi:hypothetical protein ACRALDRAFT_2040673 [Sodiomyces alcalophilus JCM 7366]|uniref:uncharacterized protein n=1 Tax=Sodiomyces alcalophilus JCM 7366 TaxID=591952 RepID=UPI0039B3AD2D